MDKSAIGRDGSGEDARGDGLRRARRRERRRMFKPARIAFGGAVRDRVLLNASPFCAHVCLHAFTEVPRHVALRLSGGGCQPVQRRRQDGFRVGFEAVGTAPLFGPRPEAPPDSAAARRRPEAAPRKPVPLHDINVHTPNHYAYASTKDPAPRASRGTPGPALVRRPFFSGARRPAARAARCSGVPIRATP